MDREILRQELTADPAGMGYAPLIHAADDQTVAERMNRRDRSGGVAVLNTRQLLEWAAANGRFERIEAAAANNNDSTGIRSIAKVALMLLSRADAQLDLAKTEHLTMLNSLLAANVLSLADKQSLVAAAATPQSRAEELFGRGSIVTASDVGAAR